MSHHLSIAIPMSPDWMVLKNRFNCTHLICCSVSDGEFTLFTGQVRCVKGEGFPHFRNPFEKGDLLIKFDINFPPQHFADEQQLKVGET